MFADAALTRPRRIHGPGITSIAALVGRALCLGILVFISLEILLGLWVLVTDGTAQGIGEAIHGLFGSWRALGQWLPYALLPSGVGGVVTAASANAATRKGWRTRSSRWVGSLSGAFAAALTLGAIPATQQIMGGYLSWANVLFYVALAVLPALLVTRLALHLSDRKDRGAANSSR